MLKKGLKRFAELSKAAPTDAPRVTENVDILVELNPSPPPPVKLSAPRSVNFRNEGAD